MINTDILYSLLLCNTHKEVINYIEKHINTNNFIKLKTDVYSIYIPKNLETSVPACVAHTDVVQQVKSKKHLSRKKHILYNNQKNCGLGADDRVGCYILLRTMISNPNDFIFCFFDLEESGGFGSRNFGGEMIKDYVSLWVGFDRCGDYDIATYSNDNESLLKAIDDNLFDGYTQIMGSFTDVATLAENTGIACINFSVGFIKEHTNNETLNLKTLSNIFSVIPILKTMTTPYKVDVESYSYGKDYYFGRAFYGERDYYNDMSYYGEDDIEKEDSDYEWDKYYVCNTCGEEFFEIEVVDSRKCPHCGNDNLTACYY